MFSVNKWLKFAMGLIVSASGVATAVATGSVTNVVQATVDAASKTDLSGIAGAHAAGYVAAGIGLVQTVLAYFAPGAGVAVTPTSGGLITHKAI